MFAVFSHDFKSWPEHVMGHAELSLWLLLIFLTSSCPKCISPSWEKLLREKVHGGKVEVSHGVLHASPHVHLLLLRSYAFPPYIIGSILFSNSHHILPSSYTPCHVLMHLPYMLTDLHVLYVWEQWPSLSLSFTRTHTHTQTILLVSLSWDETLCI